ncbi:hypothetical protein QQ045_011816 [Rhodiola kirilowii]
MSNDPIRERILSEGKATQIMRISPVGGGCINLANRYDTDVGSFFVKTIKSIGPSMFEGEALGLRLMYETGTISVPKPFKLQSVLGRKLAEMHKAGKSDKGFGFDDDNTIGSTPQINTWTSDWVEFFGEHRLSYKLKLARDQYGDSNRFSFVRFTSLASQSQSCFTFYLNLYLLSGQRLIKNLAPLFEDVAVEPCLLHGDLWSGNISSNKKGEPVILDPACYYGHNEAEFGMSRSLALSIINDYIRILKA